VPKYKRVRTRFTILEASTTGGVADDAIMDIPKAHLYVFSCLYLNNQPRRQAMAPLGPAGY
jgi:hypothetical protein